QAGEQKEDQQHPELFGITGALEDDPDDAQEQREKEIGVPPLVLLPVSGELLLAAQADAVHNGDSTEPVPILVIAALQVPLSSDKIPHEIAHVHIAELEIEHITDVLSQEIGRAHV